MTTCTSRVTPSETGISQTCDLAVDHTETHERTMPNGVTLHWTDRQADK